MKKGLIRVTVILGLLLILWFLGRATGTLQMFQTPSQAMDPSLKMRSRFFISNLKKPRRYDIIAFSRIITEKDGLGIPGERLRFVFRLVGLGGETIEIRNGYAFINGKAVDDSSSLRQLYIVEKELTPKLVAALKIDVNARHDIRVLDNDNRDSTILNLTGEEYHIAKQIGPVSLSRLPFDYPGAHELYGNNGNDWTTLNYGPVKIPDDCYFVLGDNRNMANDSRFTGPIPKKDWVGTVLGKK